MYVYMYIYICIYINKYNIYIDNIYIYKYYTFISHMYLDDPQVIFLDHMHVVKNFLQLFPICTRFFKMDNMLTGPSQTMLGKKSLL